MRIWQASVWLMMTSIFSVGCQDFSRPSAGASSRLHAQRTASESAALANVELGLGYLSQGQVSRAKAKLVHALELGPKLTDTHIAMAHFLERVGAHAEAYQEYQTALKLNREKGSTYNNYGAFLCRQGRYKEADVAFKQALSDKYYPNTASIYENAGICALQRQNRESAQYYFEQALKYDPKRTTALLELAAIRVGQQDYVSANQLLSDYKETTLPTARSTWLKLQIAQSLNQPEEAAAQAQTLQSLFRDSPEFNQYHQYLAGKQ